MTKSFLRCVLAFVLWALCLTLAFAGGPSTSNPVSNPAQISQGGTGATASSAALANLGGAPAIALTWTPITSTTASWTYSGFGFNDAAYAKDPFGIVHLRGVFAASGAATPELGAAITTMPSGCRPLVKQRVPTNSGGAFGSIEIGADGAILTETGAVNYILLDGITYCGGQ
ncbi:MAG: hypothetical protein HQM09_15245 [Candidatus Riflebacteria bacterium]|nr:hypothetical protein [Candidatus Riflebacteria bacterium]